MQYHVLNMETFHALCSGTNPTATPSMGMLTPTGGVFRRCSFLTPTSGRLVVFVVNLLGDLGEQKLASDFATAGTVVHVEAAIYTSCHLSSQLRGFIVLRSARNRIDPRRQSGFTMGQRRRE